MTRRTTRAVNPLIEPTEAIADGMTGVVGVVDQGLQGIIGALGSMDLRLTVGAAAPGPPGLSGPPGESIKGDPGSPGRDGTDAPRPVRSDVERNALGLIDRVEQFMSDGSRRVHAVERDTNGRLLALVAVRP